MYQFKHSLIICYLTVGLSLRSRFPKHDDLVVKGVRVAEIGVTFGQGVMAGNRRMDKDAEGRLMSELVGVATQEFCMSHTETWTEV